MRVTTVKEAYERQLRILAEDPRLASSVDPVIRDAVPGATEVTTSSRDPASLTSSPSLPPGVDLSAITRPRPAGTDFETLKIVSQELILPCLSSIWPQAKPYVTGVQAVWAGKEFWDALADEEVDLTQRTIKGVRAAQKVVNALLIYRGASALQTNTNMIGGLVIATADKLYAARNSA